MNTRHIRLSRPPGALLALAAALVATLGSAPALATDKARTLSAQAQYRRDVAACRTPQRGLDHDDCLSEASTALAGALPPTVDPDPGRYARNALKRCEPLAEPDRSDCVARMQGQGTTSGSVAGGGIYRELVTVTRETTVPAPAAPAAPDKAQQPK